MKNFHVRLPDETYNHLRIEAERAKVPATALVREAIDLWLRQQRRKARHEAIAARSSGRSSRGRLTPDLPRSTGPCFRSPPNPPVRHSNYVVIKASSHVWVQTFQARF